MMTVTLTKEEAQQVLDALNAWRTSHIAQPLADTSAPLIETLRAKLNAHEKTNQCGETCERAKLCAVCARGIAQPEPEPAAYRHLHEDGWEYYDAPTGDDCRGCQPLYTAPPQRKEWQGLTQREQAECWYGKHCMEQSAPYEDFVRAIEAKLREKNT